VKNSINYVKCFALITLTLHTKGKASLRRNQEGGNRERLGKRSEKYRSTVPYIKQWDQNPNKTKCTPTTRTSSTKQRRR